MFNNIKAEMARYDMTNEKLAAFLGVSVSTVKGWFNSDKSIPSSALIKMSNEWNVSSDYLLGLTNQYGEPISNNKAS